MKTKKTQKANLEKNRMLYGTLGLIFSLSLVLIVLESATGPLEISGLTGVDPDKYIEEDIINTYREEPEAPRPVPLVPQPDLNIVEDNIIVDDMPNLFDAEATEHTLIPTFEEPEEAVDDEIFVKVEEMPEFKRGGGIKEFAKYINKQVTYPVLAQEMNIQGKVTVEFVVNEKGEVDNIKIVRSVDPLLDNEVIKALSNSPKWKPGKQRDKPVKVRFTIPVVFKLS